MPRARAVALLALAAVTVAAACSGGGSNSSGGSGGSTPPSNRDPVAVGNYGYGPNSAARSKLASDVVIVDGGPGAVRSATADGLTWTIDRNAKGASQLHVGSLMLLTSRAAGRVAALHDAGPNRVVTLAPVRLGDVVPNGSIHYNNALHLGAVTYQPVPTRPGALSQPSPGDIGVQPASVPADPKSRPDVVTLPPLQLVAAQSEGSGEGKLPPASKKTNELTIGGWTVEPTVDEHEIELGVSHDEHGLKVGVTFKFHTDDLHVDTGETEQDGTSTGSRFVLRGLNGIDVALQAGAEEGEEDNTKIKIEVPIDIDLPVEPTPATLFIPFDIKLEFKFAVETAITGKNSTLFANGSYGLSGPLGVEDGKILTPSFSVKKSIIDSIGGITLGPSGLVFSLELKFLMGLGVPSAAAGPYGLITTSIGVTNGSSLGASLARCHGASLALDIGGGAELSISAEDGSLLSHLLPEGTEIKHGIEIKKTVLKRSQVVPNVPLCTQGAES